MERRNAMALAAAISMSLMSATIAFGANFGGLGSPGPSTAPVSAVAPVAAPNPAVVSVAEAPSSPAAAKAARGEHEGEGRTPTQPVAAPKAPRSEHDD
jgi:hypothetical protein